MAYFSFAFFAASRETKRLVLAKNAKIWTTKDTKFHEKWIQIWLGCETVGWGEGSREGTKGAKIWTTKYTKIHENRCLFSLVYNGKQKWLKSYFPFATFASSREVCLFSFRGVFRLRPLTTPGQACVSWFIIYLLPRARRGWRLSVQFLGVGKHQMVSSAMCFLKLAVWSKISWKTSSL